MQNISILIAEDENSLRKRLVNYISLFCDTVYEANDGCEALMLHKKHTPNIIITDINMPKIRGVDVIEKIRKTDTKTQIIILSAHTITEDFLKVVPLDLVSYLVKPLKMEELKKAIAQAIENISAINQIFLNDGYIWDKDIQILRKNGVKVELTHHERSLVEMLVLRINRDVSYEDLHNYIYNLEEYSQNAIFTLVKRIRKKTSKELIKSSFKLGYFIESV